MGQAEHRFIISLGSNYRAEEFVPYALEQLGQRLCITRESEVMLTEPVDFPHPSGLFTNVILEGTTAESKTELIHLLHTLEAYAGRDRRTPQLVPLDADLIAWDDVVLKPKDMQRPYFIAYLDRQNDERNIRYTQGADPA